MKRAFTLLEVLLAIGLIAALSGGVFSFMWQLGLQRTSITQSAQDAQAADALFERLETDLIGAVAVDSAGQAGIVGASTSLRVLSRGVGLPLKADDRAWAAGDLRGTEYMGAGSELTARRWDAHRERTGSAGTVETMSGRLGALRFRYYDGTKWKDSFDSVTEAGLPVAIEVSLWFGETVPGTAAPADRETPPEPADVLPLDRDGNPMATEADSVPSSPEGRVAARPPSPPDRTRVIVVPDGPTTTWKESR